MKHFRLFILGLCVSLSVSPRSQAQTMGVDQMVAVGGLCAAGLAVLALASGVLDQGRIPDREVNTVLRDFDKIYEFVPADPNNGRVAIFKPRFKVFASDTILTNPSAELVNAVNYVRSENSLRALLPFGWGKGHGKPIKELQIIETRTHVARNWSEQCRGHWAVVGYWVTLAINRGRRITMYLDAKDYFDLFQPSMESTVPQ